MVEKMTVYHVTAEPDGRYWFIQVPQIDKATQSKSARGVAAMASDLIEIVTGEKDPELEIEYKVDPEISDHLAQMEAARVEEAKARTKAAEELREAAKALERLMPIADVGTVLGVSRQRAAQLLAS
jgi:hypothetical protein